MALGSVFSEGVLAGAPGPAKERPCRRLPRVPRKRGLAFHHLNTGGILVTTPDVTTEIFQQNKTIATPATHNVTRDDLDVVVVENTYDPDTTDDHYETTIVYLIRSDQSIRASHVPKAR